jgi:hypothetical protein
MPQVHFVGEITDTIVNSYTGPVSVTYGFVPGAPAWFHQSGQNTGETQISSISDDGRAILNHPLDMHYVTSSSEGWPFLVCEVWSRDATGNERQFRGCGCTFLPTSPGKHTLELFLWRPGEISGLMGFYDMLMPATPDLRSLREIIVKPYVRSEVKTETCGTIRVSVNTVLAGFKEHGVLM